MELSIVIVNWNTREHLIACLESIREHPPSGEYEIIVVDNASTDGSVEVVRESFPGVRLLPNEQNLGYAKANNQAIGASEGKYILLLNPDVRVKAGAVDALMKFAEAHSNMAAVGCRLVGSDGRVQKSCRSFPEPLGVFLEYVGLPRLIPRSKRIGTYRMTYFDYTTDAEVDQPMASCLLIPRKAWEDVGPFDEGFPIFFNDVDWCYRAKERCWQIYFTASAEVIHEGGASTRQAGRAMIRESHRALRRFYAKHYRKKLWGPVYWFICVAIELNSFVKTRFGF